MRQSRMDYMYFEDLQLTMYSLNWYISFFKSVFIFNLPAPTEYGEYISNLIQYSRACGSNNDFFDRVLLLITKLLNQAFLLVKVKSSLRKFYSRHNNLVSRYIISVSYNWPWICPVGIVITNLSFPAWLITGFH